MGTITVKISDEAERILRRKAAQLYGTRKGALSRAVEEAILHWASPRSSTENRVYRAYRGEELVAEAATLEELAERLRELAVPPRGLRIVREPPGGEGEEKRLGFRARRVETWG